MRTLDTAVIRDIIARMSMKANVEIEPAVIEAFERSLKTERNPLARQTLTHLIENCRIARNEKIPICQDTGCLAVFLEIGQDVHLEGAPVEDIIQEGIRIGYKEGYLRNSMVKDPLKRENTSDNTPGIVHYTLVAGDKVRISILPKGAGCENMAKIAILKPSDGVKGVKKVIIDCIKNAGGNPCPPLFIGVGLGGSFEKAALLAKEALLLPFTERSAVPHIAQLENELLDEINKLDVGPQGLGGNTTALGLRILTYPTHIASLPVAVNISCHALRRETVTI